MTEDNLEQPVPSELETLKKRATMLKINYHPSIGVDSLKIKIEDKMSATTEEEVVNVKALGSDKIQYVSHAAYTRMSMRERKKRAGSLIRINVTMMNPNKKNWEGEIISVGSAKIGTFKKYIPFNTAEGWHVPYIIYEAMKERQCTVFFTVKDHRGKKVRKGKQIPEFNIHELDPLTKVELKELAQRQAMAANGSDD